MGKSLAENTKLEVISMRDNKAKVPFQIEFWKNLYANKTLKVINVERNRINDKVMIVISEYLS